MSELHYFLRLKNTPLYVETTSWLYVYPLRTLGLLLPFGGCEHAAVNVDIQISLQALDFNSLASYIHKSGNAGPHGGSSFHFFETLLYYLPQLQLYFTFPPTVHKASNLSTFSSTLDIFWVFFNFLFMYLFSFFIFRASPMTYRGSQARGWIRTIAASLCHSHSNTRSKPHLQPTSQLTTTQDP